MTPVQRPARRKVPEPPGAGTHGPGQNWTKAEPLFKRALAMDEKAFGLKIPTWLRSWTTWGCCTCNRGDLTRPNQVFTRALACTRRSLGGPSGLGETACSTSVAVPGSGRLMRPERASSEPWPSVRRDQMLTPRPLGMHRTAMGLAVRGRNAKLDWAETLFQAVPRGL